MFDSPFIVLGRTVQAIPFGAPDGAATDLFFLLGCPDDRLHLHTLARLCLMAQKTNLPAQLRDAPDAASMHQSILEAEQAVLGEQDREPNVTLRIPHSALRIPHSALRIPHSFFTSRCLALRGHGAFLRFAS